MQAIKIQINDLGYKNVLGFFSSLGTFYIKNSKIWSLTLVESDKLIEQQLLTV